MPSRTLTLRRYPAGSCSGAPDPEIVKASQEWLADQYIADAEKWGYIDPARWDGFYTWLTENNLVDGELPAGTGYSNDYLA